MSYIRLRVRFTSPVMTKSFGSSRRAASWNRRNVTREPSI